MGEPAGDDVDPGDVTDEAQQRSLAFYFTMAAMHTTVLNLFTAGLWHLFEQQAGVVNRELTRQQGAGWFHGIGRLVASAAGIDIQTAPSFAKLTELRLVANVVKHAEGDSAARLRAVNPDYFREPLLRHPAFRDILTFEKPVQTPLTGEDLYVTKADYDLCLRVAIDFWRWSEHQV
jgi:hypothetical protein